VYIYSYATSDTAAASEAAHVLRLIDGLSPDWPIFLDIEDNSIVNSCTKEEILNHAKIFCDLIKDAGYTPGIYANLNWFRNYLTDSYYDSLPRWIAQYYSECTYQKRFEAWQYTPSGQINGISTNVDISYLYGDFYNYNIVDSTIPSISDVSVTSFDNNSFSIKCEAKDNVAVTKVICYVWPETSTESNAKRYVAQLDDSTASLTISTSDFSSQTNITYNYKIVAYDNSINQSDYYYGSVFLHDPYVITYDMNGGNGDSFQISFNTDCKITSYIPKKEVYLTFIDGYFTTANMYYAKFLGWNTSPVGNGKYYSSGDTYSGQSTTLYAIWGEAKVTNFPDIDNYGFNLEGWFTPNDVKLSEGDSIWSNTVIYTRWKDILTFNDVTSKDYYYDSVKWAFMNNITSGTSEDLYSPEEYCTRAQTVTFLYRAAGCPSVDKTNCPFIDINESDYYYKAVLWAVSKGITSGTSENTFSPEEYCTRGQTLTFLYRYANVNFVESTDNPFVDINFSQYYYLPVLWGIANKITNGTTEITFSPEDICNRAQVVTFLYRYFNNN